MRIAYVSTYPPIECGIGTYTQCLSDAVKALEKEALILSQMGGRGQKVFPVYNPKRNDIASSIFDVAARLTPDVIHIQHEYSLFGDQHGIQVLQLPV